MWPAGLWHLCLCCNLLFPVTAVLAYMTKKRNSPSPVFLWPAGQTTVQGLICNRIRKSTIRSRCWTVALCWSRFQDWCSYSCSNGRPGRGDDSDTYSDAFKLNAGVAINEINEHHQRKLLDYADFMWQALALMQLCHLCVFTYMYSITTDASNLQYFGCVW